MLNGMQVTKANLNFKNKLSPYEGRRLSGVVHQTYVRGTLVYDKSRAGFEGLQPNGILL
jgi:allantoinase